MGAGKKHLARRWAAGVSVDPSIGLSIGLSIGALTLCSGMARQPVPPANAPATTAPATLPANDDDDSAAEIAKIKALQGVRPMKLSEVLVLTKTADHRLELETKVAETAEAQVPLTGDSGIARISVARRGEDSAISFLLFRTDVPGFSTVRYDVQNQPLTIVRNSWSKATGSQSVELFQKAPMMDNDEPETNVRLTVRDNEIKSAEITAANVDQLIRRHPSEAARYLKPMLRELGMDATLFAGDLKEAWQVLGADAPADAAVAKKIEAALPQLDSDDAAVRERGHKELAGLGQAGVTALQGWDRNKLTPQQNSELDVFLAAYSPVTAEDVALFRVNPDRLASYLSLEDAAVRKLAYARLKLLAKDVPAFDADGAADVRAGQIGKIEAFIAGATTRP